MSLRLYLKLLRKLIVKQRFNIWVIFFLIAFLYGCAGTGVKGYSYQTIVSPIINSSEKGKVFLYRKIMPGGSGVVVPVNLNGSIIGKLGVGEIIWSDTISGPNTIQAKVTGIQGLGLSAPNIKFDNDDSNNYFFLLYWDQIAFGYDLRMIQTTEEVWKKNLN